MRIALVLGSVLMLASCASTTTTTTSSTTTTAPAVAASRTLSAAEAGELLRAAAREGDVDVVSGLADAGADVDSADDRGHTALILAAYHGHVTTVSSLLQHGADACRGDGFGNTALMGAVFRGHTEVVRLLLPRCPVDQQSAAGRTALMFASLVGRDDMKALLVDAGADSGHVDGDGRTAEDWSRTQR